MEHILLAVFYFLFPAVIIYFSQRYSVIDKIGTAIICYGVGILISLIGSVPPGSKSIQEVFLIITVPLSIPLFLFNIDIKRWSRLAGKTFLSLIFIIISVLTVTLIGYFIFRERLGESWQVAGMLIGVYTGGTPNLNAIGVGLNAEEHLIVLTNTADMLVCAPWFFFILLLGQRVLNTFLPAFEPIKTVSVQTDDGHEKSFEGRLEGVDFNDYTGFFSRKKFLPLLIALGTSVLIFAAGGAIYSLVPRDLQMAALMLSITTFGIGCSFIRPIRNIDMTFQLGQYIILVFCVVVGSMADPRELVTAAPVIVMYTALVVYGSWLMHLLLSAIFRIDTDTTIITSTAALFSPPFIPAVASALKNREIVVSGLATGIIGYAIGNYLGITIGLILSP